MKRKLFLHIGYPKTGTTTLQRFLARNSAALAASGVLYPETGRLGDAHYGVNFALGIADYDRPRDVPRSTTIAEDLAAEADSAGAHSIIISSEYFITASHADRLKIQQMFAGYDLRIVCYLRRHDRAFEAAYTQALKSVAAPPWSDTIHGFIVYHLGMGTVSYEYLSVLRQWAGMFGAGAVIVRPYEAAQNVPDLPGDFLAAVGLGTLADLPRPPSANPSFGPRTAAAIRMVRATGLEDARKQHVIGQLVGAAPWAPEDAGFLTSGEREAIIRRYTPMYRQIAKEFLGRDSADLFVTPPPPGPAREPRQYGAEELVETILRALTPRPA